MVLGENDCLVWSKRTRQVCCGNMAQVVSRLLNNFNKTKLLRYLWTTKNSLWQRPGHHHNHHQSLNREGRCCTTYDFATSFLHFSLFSTALWDLPNSRPVHSLMSSHLFLRPPVLLLPFTVPYKMVLARPDERETWPYNCSLRLFTIVRRSLCGPIACWILAQTSSLVTWSLYEMCSILR